MKNRLKYPLSLFIVWHPGFVEGKEIASNLYSLFCRDVEDPLSRGLGIPVYFRSKSFKKLPISIDKYKANRNAIVLLIDQEYLIDDNFNEYTKTLIKLVDENTRIYPVQLCNEAFSIGCGLESYQFIRVFQDDLKIKANLEVSIQKLRTELLHDCARLLINFHPTWEDGLTNDVPSPIRLFLSHAKKDGLEIVREFKEFIDAELKLDVFFDAVDIADSYAFEQQIESNIRNSALVVFHTDEYSTREWCRIEVLIAKRNKCSIVVVNGVKNGEKRAFPYLGNTPTITLKQNERDNFIEIVNLTIYQVINNIYQRELLKSFQDLFPVEGSEYITITSPPELFNYIDIYKKKRESQLKLIVLYPEPPLGLEELKILNEIDTDIQFITPILLPTLI